MAAQYRTGIIITGDAKGGVRAAQLTDAELKKLNTTQKKNNVVQKKAQKETEKSGKSMKDYAGKLGLVTSAFTALSGIVAGIGIASIVKETVAATRETKSWAQAIGISTQQLQASDYAAQALGLQQGKIGDIYKDTAEKIGDAYTNKSGEAVQALKNINLSAEQLINLSPDKQLLAIAHGLDSIGTKAAKIQIMEALASDASLLIPLLDDNAKRLRSLKKEAIESGVALSNIDTAKLSLLDAQFRQASGTTKGLANQLTVALAPAIFGATKEINTLTMGWAGTGNITAKAVDIAVKGLGFVLDIGKNVLIFLAQSKIGWLEIGKAGVDAFVSTGQSGVDLLNAVLQPIRDIIGRIINGYGLLIKLAADVSGNAAWESSAKSVLGYAAAIKSTKLTMSDFVNVQKNLQTQINKSKIELVKFINTKAPSDVLHNWMARQRKEISRLAAANLAAANARGKNNASINNSVAQNKKLTKSLAPIAQLYKDTATSIRNAFSGAFRAALDGQNNFKDKMISVFKDLLAQMATLAIARPIIVPIVSGVGGLLGISGSAQAGVVAQLGGAAATNNATSSGLLAGIGMGGLSNIFGFSGFAGMGGQQGAQLAAQNAGFGGAGEALTAQAAGNSSLLSSAGSALGAGFIGYMAGGVASKIFNVANPQMASALTAVGAAIAGPIGGAVGFAVGSLFGGSFKTTGTGLNLSIANSNISGQTFVNQHKRGGLFSGSSDRTTTSALSSDLQAQLQTSFDLITHDFSAMGKTLGHDASAVLANFSASAHLSLQGLSQDAITKKIDGFVQDVKNKIALQILPGLVSFQRAGEDAANTLTRLVQTLTTIHALDKTISDNIDLLTNATTAQSLALNNASTLVVNTLSAIADTTDITQRVALEKQLTEQVQSRYALEQTLLNDMVSSINQAITSISNLRSGIAGNIASITGAPASRDLSAIRQSFNASLPDNAPVFKPVDLTDVNARLSAAEQHVVNEQNKLAIREGWLSNLLSDPAFSKFVDNLNASNSAISNEIKKRSDEVERIKKFYAGKPGLLIGAGLDIKVKKLNKLINLLQFKGAISAAQQSLTSAQTDFSSAKDSKAAADKKAAEALTAYNKALKDYLNIAGGQVDKLKQLKDETLQYYNAQKKLDTALRGAADNIGATLARLQQSQLTPAAQLNNSLDQFRGLVAQSKNATGFNLADISQQLNAAVDPLLNQARTLFASGSGFQNIFKEVTDALSVTQKNLIAQAPVNYQQGSLDLLGSIDSVLADVQTGLTASQQSVINAIDKSRTDTVATLQDIRGLLGGDARTITGKNGSFANGLAQVPFDGFNATLHKDEAVIDAATMASLRKYGIAPGRAANDNIAVLLPKLERMVQAVEQGGNINLRVVTPDGKVLKEETIRDIKRRSEHGELVVHAAGVFA